MHILMISTDRKIFERNSEVARRMADYGTVLDSLDIVVMAPRLTHPQGVLRLSDRVTVYSTESLSKLTYVPGSIRLARGLLARKKYVWISAQDPFECGLVAAIARLGFNVKVQLQIHTDLYSRYFGRGSFLNKLRLLLAGFLLPRADRIRVVSQKIRESLLAASLSSPGKIDLLPVFVDYSALEAQAGQGLKERYPEFDRHILMASRLTAEKNIPLALEAFSAVVLRCKKTGLIIVGEGPAQAKIRDTIKTLSLEPFVRLEGWNNALFAYFRSADVYLMTSWYEGFGRTLAEAVAAGTPFVSTDVGIAGELVAAGAKGKVVPVGDSNALSRALCSALQNESETEAIKDDKYFLSREQFLARFRQGFET